MPRAYKSLAVPRGSRTPPPAPRKGVYPRSSLTESEDAKKTKKSNKSGKTRDMAKEAFSSSASSSANNSETECEEEEESEEQQDGESGSEYSPSNTQDSSKQKPHAARKQRAKVRFTRTGATQNKALVLAKEMMNTALSQLNLIENEYTKTLQRLGKEVEEARKALREYRQREGSAGHDHGDCKREIAELKAAVKVRDRELVARYE